MRRSRTLEFRISGGVGGLLVVLLGGLTARVGVVEAAVCGAVDEEGAVGLWDKGEDVEGWEGVDGVVWARHVV